MRRSQADFPRAHCLGGSHPVLSIQSGGIEELRREARPMFARLIAVIDTRCVAVVVGRILRAKKRLRRVPKSANAKVHELRE